MKKSSLRLNARMAQKAAREKMSSPPLSDEELAVALTTPQRDIPPHLRYAEPMPHIAKLKDPNDEAWDLIQKELREKAGEKPKRKKR